MKKDAQKLVGVVLSLVIVGGILKAQPDLGVVGKGENPANRDAAQRAAQKEAARAARKAPNQRAIDKLAERETARQELKLERLPRYLNAYGIRDEKIQQAVQAHLKASLKERENITRSQYQLRRLLVMPNSIEAQIKAASGALIQAEKSYATAFEKSRIELDQKIAYTKNARLEAALLAVGALDPKGMAGAL
ncbi:MAG TPA: hypothetical protein VGB77_07415 [Abditibacteriaceae bacterium]|jgi:small-conductance mechanosensitive channel